MTLTHDPITDALRHLAEERDAHVDHAGDAYRAAMLRDGDAGGHAAARVARQTARWAVAMRAAELAEDWAPEGIGAQLRALDGMVQDYTLRAYDVRYAVGTVAATVVDARLNTAQEAMAAAEAAVGVERVPV